VELAGGADQRGDVHVVAAGVHHRLLDADGVDQDTFAAATITRLGNRVANVEAHAWQSDRSKPIAATHMNLLLRRR